MLFSLFKFLHLHFFLKAIVGEPKANYLAEKFRRALQSPSFWALTDQAVLSLGTFATNIVVLRSYKTNPTEFGTYALLISIVALLNNLHASVITYPLSVKGATADKDGLRSLATSALALTGVLAAPMSLVVVITAAVLHSVSLAPFVAASLLAWQFQETCRRGLMAHLRNNEAVWGDFISYIGQAGVVIALCHGRTPPLWQIFIAMTLTSLAAGLLQMFQLRLRRVTLEQTKRVAVEGWTLGRWLLLTNGLNLLTIQMIAWTIDYFHGRAAVGTFVALASVIGVSHPIMFGISNLIVPGVAKARKESNDHAARKYAMKLGLIGLGLLLPYYAFLLIAPGLALRLFCGAGSPYLGVTTELRWYVIQYLFVYVSFVTMALLNGMEAGRWTFYGQLANAISTVFVRIPATAFRGVSGAIWSGVVAYAIQVLVNGIGLTRTKPAHSSTLSTPVGGLEPIVREPVAADLPPLDGVRRRILVSAYTLSPKRGSEPAGAWNVIVRLAKHHDLTVLTSPNVEGDDYRTETLAFLRNNPIEGLTLHYVDPPPLALKLMKPSGTLARLFYYIGYAAWQRKALEAAQTLHERRPFDLVHQLNMTGYREPGYLYKLPIPFVWGPVAGASNMPYSFLSLMDRKEKLFYGIRNIANQIQRITSLRCREAARASRVIWYVGSDEKDLIERHWHNLNTEPMLDSGTTILPRPRPSTDPTRPLRLVWSGVHIGRKGFPILLHALSQIKNKNVEVIVLGAGPQTERWDTLAARLGVSRMIQWRGKLPRQAALKEMAAADALAFTSLMEAASHVTLEAISMGLPVLCHDACGMSIAVDDTCGMKVPLVDVQTSVIGFARAIAKLADDRELLARLTDGAERRATELTWDAKVDQIARGYQRVLAHVESAFQSIPDAALPLENPELGPSASVPL